MLGGHTIGNAGGLDLVLGAHQPLRHRRLRNQERARDLVRRQTTEQTERERDARVRHERRMAAREDQPQPIVRHGFLLVYRLGYRLHSDVPEELALARVAPQPVKCAVAGSRRDPASRIERQSIRRPPLQCHSERFLNRVLGEVDIAEDPDQRRTSIGTPMQWVTFAAQPSAASRSSASIM